KLHSRRLDSREAAEVGEEAVEREVAVAEDVALADDAALGGEQVAARHVLHADDVQSPIDVGGNLAAHEPADDGGRGTARIAWAEDMSRVDDDRGQPPGDEAQRDRLGLVL